MLNVQRAASQCSHVNDKIRSAVIVNQTAASLLLCPPFPYFINRTFTILLFNICMRSRRGCRLSYALPSSSGKEEERQMFQQMQAMAQKQVSSLIIIRIHNFIHS